MELRRLRYFAVVAEELHFGRAAARLNMSQPPLSIQIKKLEDEIGVTLFIRKRHIELTPAGKEFLEYARNALQQVQLGIRSAKRVHLGELGQLNVGFISSMGYTYIPALLAVFRKRRPDVELALNDLDTWSQFAAIKKGSLHVGVVRGPVDEPGISSVTVLTERLVVAMPINHRHSSARKVSIRDLAHDSFILSPRNISRPLNREVLRLCQRVGFTPHVSQEAIQLHVVVSLVSAGIGIAIVPESTQLLPVPGVVFRPLAERDGRAHIAVVFRTVSPSPLVREFVDVAQRLFSNNLARSKLAQFPTKTK